MGKEKDDKDQLIAEMAAQIEEFEKQLKQVQKHVPKVVMIEGKQLEIRFKKTWIDGMLVTAEQIANDKELAKKLYGMKWGGFKQIK
jgi:ABC-type Fe3+-hydroxamate transport system substrate-binding protein